MTSAFDNRILKIGLEIDGQVTEFSGVAIKARGRKFGSATMNECEVQIYNLPRDTRNFILTQASPLKSPRTPINLYIDVGRESYGTFRLFEGQVIACGATQPPDIGITLRSLTNSFFTGTVAGYAQSGMRPLRTICQAVANSMGLALEYQATDKQIDNYSFTGSAVRQIEKLEQMGGVQAYIDNGKLVVINSNATKDGAVRTINMNTGMVGIPQVTDYGVIVKMMLDNSIELGGGVIVESEINPAANGLYKVLQINFDIANREEPFWYTLGCFKPGYAQGTIG